MRLNLKVRLLKAGRPAWQVAQELGIRADLLSKITSGSVDPGPELRTKLAAYFDADEDVLFEDTAQHASETGGIAPT